MHKLLTGLIPRSAAARWILVSILFVLSIFVVSKVEMVMFPGENSPTPMSIHDYALKPVKHMEDQNFESWTGLLKCEAVGTGSPYEDERDLLISLEGILAYDGGDSEEFYQTTEDGTVVLAELPFHFEWWRGVVLDGKVKVEGWYAQGNTEVKPIAFSGVLSDGKMSLQGTRGPRDCTLEAELQSNH